MGVRAFGWVFVGMCEREGKKERKKERNWEREDGWLKEVL